MRRADALREAARLAPAGRVKDAAARALFRSLAEAWDAWYGAFHHADDETDVPALASRLAPLARRGSLLEVGCGDGALLAELAARCREVHGVDASARALALARRRCRGLANARLRRLRGWRLPFGGARFDAVVSRRTLHVLDPEGAIVILGEIRRVLRPGGRVAFDLPSFYDDAHLRALTTRGATPWPSLTRPRFWTAGMVRALLPRLGLELRRLSSGPWLDVVAARV